MKKNYCILLLVIFSLAFVPAAWANGNQSGRSESAGGTESAQGEAAQIGSQFETKTANQGEESQLRVTANYSVQTMTQQMSQVRNQVSAQTEEGKQIHAEVQDQEQRQEQVKMSLNKLSGREGLVRQILGPNYRALKTLESAVGENEMQIQAFKEYQNQYANKAEESAIREMIGALEAENTALQQRIREEESRPGLLGWLLKLFA